MTDPFLLPQFVELQPALGEQRSLYMLEFFGVSVTLSNAYPAEHLKVQLWTNALHKLNRQGDWHSIDLHYRQPDADGNWVFDGGFWPTTAGEYEFTYRASFDAANAEWHWAGEVGHNGKLVVFSPSS